MARKKVSTTVYLTEDQVAGLKELHERTRVPIAEYIRMGIDMILEQYAHTLPGQVSLFGDAPKTAFGRKPSRGETEALAGTAQTGQNTENDDNAG